MKKRAKKGPAPGGKPKDPRAAMRNARRTAQTRKLLGTHYANKYRKGAS
ncbi:MAG: hypothetical protein ACE5GS_10250 [Kiloniellaceae bacterium]